MSRSQWPCPRCTFLNGSADARCLSCDEGRVLVPALVRTESEVVAEATGVSRTVARRAIAAAGGDLNDAVANLLLNVMDPLGPPPVATLAAHGGSLTSMAGVSPELARAFMEECGGDVTIARSRLLAEFGAEAGAREGVDLANAVLPPPPTDIECPVCLGMAAAADACILSCTHMYCRACLKAHVESRMGEGDAATIPCPECTTALTQNELRRLLGDRAFATLDRRALEAAVAVDATLHLCPTPDCPNVVAWAGPQDGLPRIDCNVCGQNRCEMWCSPCACVCVCAHRASCFMWRVRRWHTRRCLICGVAPYHTGVPCRLPPLRVAGGGPGVAASGDGDAAMRAYMATAGIRLCSRCGNASFVT